ncbi:hypothetical protein Q8G35_14295 [Peribacillus simplex]|uniref:Uncharacterized protein n=2 Tax=Peribacillus TaxID=2675229 RepID=A0AA90PKS8_9BACI|nr:MULTISPECIES: hypothetical protein [Peribacillus]MDP1419573.1 hypothetical protein [Peribacillus simplex]MDP1452540.1 hypothetical protein [Peribacillus frigoritolerans]
MGVIFKNKKRKEDIKLKKIIILFAAVVIASSLGHQINGGYNDPRKSRPRHIHLK